MTEATHTLRLNRLCRFRPQAWYGDNSFDVDPEGETEWHPSEGHLATLYASDPIEWDAGMRDRLRDDPAAPQWVREWTGPFEVEVSRA